MSRRLEKKGRGFLCGQDGSFAADLARLSPRRDRGSNLLREVASAVERFNVAGLCDSSKRNWYAVDLQDTVRGAHKLGVAPREVEELIRATITS